MYCKNTPHGYQSSLLTINTGISTSMNKYYIEYRLNVVLISEEKVIVIRQLSHENCRKPWQLMRLKKKKKVYSHTRGNDNNIYFSSFVCVCAERHINILKDSRTRWHKPDPPNINKTHKNKLFNYNERQLRKNKYTLTSLISFIDGLSSNVHVFNII